MTAKGHMTLATTATLISFNTLPYFKKLQIGYLVGIYIFILFGSVLPDLDEENSYIGRKLPLFSVITSSIFKHRTITHYFFIPLIIVFFAFVSNGLNRILLLSLSFGVFMHDVGDMLTKGGIIGFFFPFFPNTRVALLPRFFRFYTDSITEYMIILFLMFINLFLAYLFIRGY